MIAKLFDNYAREKFSLNQVPGEITRTVFDVYNKLEKDFQISQGLLKEMSIERRLGVMSRIMDDVVRYTANKNPNMGLEHRVYNA